MFRLLGTFRAMGVGSGELWERSCFSAWNCYFDECELSLGPWTIGRLLLCRRIREGIGR